MFTWRKIAVACVFATIVVALAIEALGMVVTGKSFVATASTVVSFALVIEVLLLFILGLDYVVGIARREMGSRGVSIVKASLALVFFATWALFAISLNFLTAMFFSMIAIILAIPPCLAIWAYASERKEHPADRYIPRRVKNRVWRRDGERCVQCGSDLGVDFYHIVPVSRGGSNTEENVQLLCKWCGQEKTSTT